jgi:hypothetical protein
MKRLRSMVLATTLKGRAKPNTAQRKKGQKMQGLFHAKSLHSLSFYINLFLLLLIYEYVNDNFT